MADPDYVPPWFKQFTPAKVEYHSLDSFGMQYAVCEESEDGVYERCDLYAYVPDKGLVKYGKYYGDSNNYAVILPPNVYRYSGYDAPKYVIKDGKVEEYQNGMDLSSVDYVVVEG